MMFASPKHSILQKPSQQREFANDCWQVVSRCLFGSLLSLLMTCAAVPNCLPLYSQDPGTADKTDSATSKDGATIYQEMCASCHGTEGEGVTGHYSAALIGDRPVIDLAKLIEDTMPEEDPSLCVGEDARKVAQYIYDTFYSEVAQARRRPAQLEISRLTVPQYRNAIIDLLGSFGPRGWIGPSRGLSVTYYDSRGFNNRSKVEDGIDNEIRFAWGTIGPLPEQLYKPEFSVRWEGSVIAPETGNYDFVVRTNNGTRLWINDRQTALIDAWVRSGNDQEYRNSIFLVAGRPYYLRLEFFKAKEDKNSSIELAWRLPSGVESVVSGRYLTPYWVPDLVIPSTPFPPDDRSIGYERGTTISKAWEQATTMGAIEVADAVVRRLPQLAGLGKEDPAQQRDKVKAFALNFIKRAIRRPLTLEEEKRWIDRHFDDQTPVETSIKRIVLLTLKSPSFLYVDRTRETNDTYQIASRLAFAIWDSIPDDTLLEKAASGELRESQIQRDQVYRMLQDSRAKVKLRSFINHWIGTQYAIGLSKSSELFPGFDATTVSDLQTSFDLFIDDVLRADKPDFRLFLSADYLYLNERLAKLYGYDTTGAPSAGSNSTVELDFKKLKMDPQQRRGVLTHPLLLAMYSYHNASSPIHRGVFMTRHVLGRRLKPPPEAVSPFSEDLHPSLTTRERTILQTKDTSCRSCHGLINPLGFALENFDAIGKFRSEEKGKPIDAHGEYLQKSGELAKFEGILGLSDFLLTSTEVQDAFIEQLFHHMIKQPVRAYGYDTPENLRQKFLSANFDIYKLMVDIAEVACRGPSGSSIPSERTVQVNSSSISNEAAKNTAAIAESTKE